MRTKLFLSLLVVALLSSCASENLTVEKPTFADDKEVKSKTLKSSKTRYFASDFR